MYHFLQLEQEFDSLRKKINPFFIFFMKTNDELAQLSYEIKTASKRFHAQQQRIAVIQSFERVLLKDSESWFKKKFRNFDVLLNTRMNKIFI